MSNSERQAGAGGPVLTDILAPALALVFVGINPSLYSAVRGHYFARPSNRFWSLLNGSGLAPVRVGPEDDQRLLEFGIGLTDLVARATVSAAKLTREDYAVGRVALREKLLVSAPLAVCFVGKLAYAEFSGRRDVRFGRQAEGIGLSVVFVMPSTSGRVNQLQEERVRVLAEVRAFLGR